MWASFPLTRLSRPGFHPGFHCFVLSSGESVISSLAYQQAHSCHFPGCACVDTLRKHLHAGRDSHARTAQGLRLAFSGGCWRFRFHRARGQGQNEAAKTPDRGPRGHLSRYRARGNLPLAWAERRRQVYDRRRAHHTHSTNLRPGVHWRARRLAKSGRRQAPHRRRRTAAQS